VYTINVGGYGDWDDKHDYFVDDDDHKLVIRGSFQKFCTLRLRGQ
jgi:hypothetical protein